MSFPPGPRGVIEVARAFHSFTREPPAAMMRLIQHYRGTAGFNMAGERIVFLGDPELIAEVLLDKDGVFVKDRVTRGLSSLLGQGLLTSEGDLWRRQRKLIAPSLTKKHIALYADSMVRLAEKYASSLGDGQERDVAADMSAATLEMVVDTLFGTSLGGGQERVGRAIDSVMEDFQEIIQTWRRAFPEWVPFAARRRTQRMVAEIDEVVLRVVRERRASGARGDDLLSRLLVARDEADPTGGMDDRQLRDEVVTLFIAGHETTANALAWTLLLLAEHPELDARLFDEVRRVLGDRAATVEDLPALPFTEAVLKESMRLYPPAHIIGREPLRDVKLGAWSIPAGATVLISPWALHHDPRFWDDPEAFRPDRWTDGSTADLPRYAYMPFGGGPRICVGNHFAMMEAVLVLATIVRRVRFERISRAPVRSQFAITLRPEGGLALRVRSRSNASRGRSAARRS